MILSLAKIAVWKLNHKEFLILTKAIVINQARAPENIPIGPRTSSATCPHDSTTLPGVTLKTVPEGRAISVMSLNCCIRSVSTQGGEAQTPLATTWPEEEQ